MSLLTHVTHALRKESAQTQELILNPFQMKSFEDYRYHVGLAKGLATALELIRTTIHQATEEDE